MNELLLNNDLTVLNNSLQHYGVGGMEWYKHKYGDWEQHARYAAGRSKPTREEKKKRTSLEAASQSAAKLRMRETGRALKAANKEEKIKNKIDKNPEKWTYEKAEKKLGSAHENAKRTASYAKNAAIKSKKVDKELEKYVADLKKKYGETKIKDLTYKEKYKYGQSLGKYLKSNALMKRTVSTEAKNLIRLNTAVMLDLPLIKYESYEPGSTQKKTNYDVNPLNRKFSGWDSVQLAYAHNKMKKEQ